MDDLIEALEILRQYGNPSSPTHCEHDTLWVNIQHKDVSEGDLARLEELGFRPENEGGGFSSFRFGSC